MSPIFKRDREYTFKIYSNEEERMHIHVLSGGKEAKFWLEPNVELAKNHGFAEHELHKLQKTIERHANKFREQYQEHIGKRIDD